VSALVREFNTSRQTIRRVRDTMPAPGWGLGIYPLRDGDPSRPERPVIPLFRDQGPALALFSHWSVCRAL